MPIFWTGSEPKENYMPKEHSMYKVITYHYWRGFFYGVTLATLFVNGLWFFFLR